jgi:hypothetical protein
MIVDELTMIKSKLMTTEISLETNQSENKANRVTIQRLVNEINRFEKSTTDIT